MSRHGDRRSAPRFEVVGPLNGSLEFAAHAPIVDISQCGMLVAADAPPPLDARLMLRLLFDGEQVSVDARVCHFRPVTDDIRTRYLVGFEFLSRSPMLDSAIERLIVRE